VRIIIVGPGRAGGALAVAAHRSGHTIAAVVARRADDQEVADQVGVKAVTLGSDLPPADLVVLSVRDDALPDVATAISSVAAKIKYAIHLSGLAPVSVLEPLRAEGVVVGSFHPLQTLPDWRTGAAALRGSAIAITAGEALSGVLTELAASLGAESFQITDDAKPLYHAAAAACSNYVITALALAQDLFGAAGVDHYVARPLVDAVVANAFEIGALQALTGPIARGDVDTVKGQIAAIGASLPEAVASFKTLGRETAALAGTDQIMASVLS
jgi:predicted short-subunit dehydrogenase-like oxidoreductase (DUF2520 family)